MNAIVALAVWHIAFAAFGAQTGSAGFSAMSLGDANEYTFVTLAGRASVGSEDGTGSAARFNYSAGIGVDSAGNVYVADSGNYTIRKVTATGLVSTLAGLAGSRGSSDGTRSAARFSDPRGLAIDSVGNAFVAEFGNHTIRKITPGGVVTTLAGLAGSEGSLDGTGAAARFSNPEGVTVDRSGNVYVADTGNHTIRKITPGGVVTTLAGLAGTAGSSDGIANAARFSYPRDVDVDSAGNVYVADSLNNTIRKITPTGVVNTLAGRAGSGGSTDGAGSAARFSYPRGVAVDNAGNVYATDNHSVRMITSAGVVSTLAGLAGSTGSSDGAGNAARFFAPQGVAVVSTGELYVADFNAIRKITPAGVVSTLAGIGESTGSSDETANSFSALSGVAVDSTGNLYVADSNNYAVRKVTPGGVISTLARLAFPRGVALDSVGNLYVAAAGDRTIGKITPDGVVSTLAGMAGSEGIVDGAGAAARFSFPEGVAVDGSGNVYVTDSYSHTIRKITPGGVVSTLAGLAGSEGIVDGAGAAARFSFPEGVAVDSAGNVYVADSRNHAIRKISSSGLVSTLAGLARIGGSSDGTGSAARFYSPSGLAVDRAGNLYVVDQWNFTLRKITPDAVVSTLAGLAGFEGSLDGTRAAARFSFPRGVAVDAGNNIYLTEFDRIRRSVSSALDRPVIDQSDGSIGVVRQLDISPFTANAWTWTQIRRPAGSLAQLSSAKARNPTFIPDVGDLYVFRLAATNAAGAVSIRTVELMAKERSLSGESVVYDNLGTSLNRSFAPAGFGFEFGDQVFLAGTNRFMTEFQFNYFLSTNRSGNESAELFFYSNDGGAASRPGTLLYRSGRFTLDTGFQTASVQDLSVQVQNTFTWVVKFEGIDLAEQAGLLLFNPPVVGGSFDDFWVKNTDGTWSTFLIDGGATPANFGARIAAASAVRNDPPTISAIADQSTEVNTGTRVLAFTVGDTETSAGDLVVSATSSNPTLVPNGNIFLGGSGATRSVFVQPAAGQQGQATITVVVTDKGPSPAKIAATTFVLTVGANKAPTISSLPSQTTQRNKSTPAIPFTIGDAETPPGSLTLSGVSSNNGLVSSSGITFGGTGTSRTITLTPVANASGTTTITVTVTDGGGRTASRSFTLTVNMPPPVKGDFDGDGQSDILFQDSEAFMAVWLMNAATLNSAGFLLPSNLGDANYYASITGDFNSDGFEDIVFQHKDGTLAVWFMNGTAQASASLLTPSNPGDSNWRAVTAGDLNKDGKPDVIFQHTDGTLAVWYMNGIMLSSAALMNPSNVGLGWRAVATGDFDSDGTLDLIFQHVDGSMAVWLLEENRLVRSIPLNPQNPGPGWRLATTVRFRPSMTVTTDLLFQHTNYDLAVWFMDGTNPLSSQQLNPRNSGGTWKVAGPLLYPIISTPPQYQTVSVGASVTFGVVAGGSEPLRHQWRKGGAIIPGATNPTLTLQNVQTSDAGNYSVVVSNAAGSATSQDARLDVSVIVTDTIRPTASLVAGSVSSPGDSPFSFQVVYSDNIAIRVSDLDDNDLRVTGPNGFSQSARFVRVDNASNGTPRTATYRIDAPQGNWRTRDSGSYTVVSANQVSDTSGNVVASGSLGTFQVSIPNVPPAVSILSPTSGATIIAGAPVLITARASDSDGAIARVEFFAVAGGFTNLIGTVNGPAPNNTYDFAWTNAQVGAFAVMAKAYDDLGASGVSAPISVRIDASPGPSFSFEMAEYQLNETDRLIEIKVIKEGSEEASVQVRPRAIAATEVGDNDVGDFVLGQRFRSLSFARGQTSTNITVGIVDDFISEPTESFELVLQNPTGPNGASVGKQSSARITITDQGDELNNQSSPFFRFPDSPPANAGRLEVVFQDNVGRWRFPWELLWRTNAQTANQLVADTYEIEFEPIDGYLQPTNRTVPVRPDVTTPDFPPPYRKTASTPSGTLTVSLNPGESQVQSEGRWKRDGEAGWHSTGDTIRLPAGTHLVIFKALTNNWVTPRTLRAVIVEEQETVLTGAYGKAIQKPPSLILLDSLAKIARDRTRPYAFNGQIVTDVDSGSGFVVRSNVVLTAAHVVFDEVNLTYAPRVWWHFQRQAGEYDPKPGSPRGFFVLDGYAAQRAQDRRGGVGAGTSTFDAYSLDAAALYFLEAAGRNGYGGYLSSDAPQNGWLTNSEQKLLVGYPVVPGPIANETVTGRMHFLSPEERPFSPVGLSKGVYSSTEGFVSVAGNSGGPLYVLTNRFFFPAGIYLADFRQRPVVRAIDSDVVNLINLASSAVIAYQVGTNQSANIGIPLSPGLVGPVKASEGMNHVALRKQVNIELAPRQAVAAGAGWRLPSRGMQTFTTASVFTLSLQTGTNYLIEFNKVKGFYRPDSRTIEVPWDQANSNVVRQIFTPNFYLTNLTTDRGLKITLVALDLGKYVLEHSPSLDSNTVWKPIETNSVINTVNQLTIDTSARPGLTSGFFRARLDE